MQLNKIMTHNVETIHPNDPIREAAQKMKSLDVGSLPVCDNRKVLGMVTDRDITIRTVAEGRDPNSTKVSDAMTPDLVFCYDDQEVEDAARMMEKHQIRRLPIMSRNNELVGIVSLGDVAVKGRDDKLSGEALEEISVPAKPER
jgi:CBS domain-containing protein